MVSALVSGLKCEGWKGNIVLVLTNSILVFFLTVCHKMSTYEFIVNSRDSRPNLSDVEAGMKSPASRKLFKVFAHFILLEGPL